MSNRLFENIEETLKKEKKFINNKARIFENEVCNLVSLEDKRISIKKEIHYLFSENMYKYRGFSNAMKFLKKETSLKIKETMNLHNITKSMATASCKNPEVKLINFWLRQEPRVSGCCPCVRPSVCDIMLKRALEES